MKKFLGIIFYTILLSVIILYFGIVFLLPQIFNSKIALKKIQTFIYSQTGIETNINGLNLKITPELVFMLNIDDIAAKYNNIQIVDIKKLALNYKLLQNHLKIINADNISINGNGLQQIPKPQRKKNNNTKFNFDKIPEINIKKLDFIADNIYARFQNICTENQHIKFKANIDTPYLSKTVKIGNSGDLQIIENQIFANKLKFELGSSQIYLDGTLFNKDKKYDFNLKGEGLPVSELMPTLLHFQKSQDPTKKFIENFKNYKGSIKLDLKFNDTGIWGKGIAYNLGANAVWFDIPLYFKEAVFDFKGDTITSNAKGILGKEQVIHTLNITKLGTEDKEVIGTMKTVLTKKFDYVPNLTILNTVDTGLVYKIKYKKIDVFYDVDINEGSDLIYNTSYLGLRDYKRKIYAHTYKDNNDLYLKEYKYSYFKSNKENIVISGDGLFIKINDKFTPQYITCHTNGFAPISVTGSFGEKVKGGEFSGDLKYDVVRNKVTGTFDIRNARHKAFRIENAHVEAQNGIVDIKSNGLYKGQKYTAEITAKNNFLGETLIYDMKLFLDKLILETTENKHQRKKINSEEIAKKVKNTDITINNWEITINKIQREKFELNNVKLIGSLKNHLFDFNMEKLDFADGTVGANGIYDFKNNTSSMTFVANNINSDKAAKMMLNLENQIEGTANTIVKLKAKDMFRYLDVNCIFEVKEGFLPRLGDAEFAIKNSKYKLSKITNFDLSQKDLMKFDIKGSFDVHNTEIKNIDITSWHEESSIYLEGNYEMEKQLADLQLFWKYDKRSSKGITIFHIPLNLILKVVFRPEKTKNIYQSKLAKVPDIYAKEKDTKYYRIQVNGDINHNKLNVTLKEIK